MGFEGLVSDQKNAHLKMLRLGFLYFDKMRVFEVLFWCAPENTIFLVVSELPVKKGKEIQKSAIHAAVLFGGLGASAFLLFLSLLGIFSGFFSFFCVFRVPCSSLPSVMVLVLLLHFFLLPSFFFLLLPFSLSFFLLHLILLHVSLSLVFSFFPLSHYSCYSSS